MWLLLGYFKVLKAPLSSGKRAVERVIFSHQVFIKCKHTLCVPNVCFWICVFKLCAITAYLAVCRLHHGQFVHLFYWASQNSSGPSVIVCLCVTDTSKSRGKASLAARVVSEPNLQLDVWLACTTILSVAHPACSYVCVYVFVHVPCGVCQTETRGCLCAPLPINSVGVGAVANG